MREKFDMYYLESSATVGVKLLNGVSILGAELGKEKWLASFPEDTEEEYVIEPHNPDLTVKVLRVKVTSSTEEEA